MSLELILAAVNINFVAFSVFLGDLVGYGPYPKECVQLAMELENCLFLRGNHDEQVAKGESSDGNNRLARESLNWTVQ